MKSKRHTPPKPTGAPPGLTGAAALPLDCLGPLLAEFMAPVVQIIESAQTVDPNKKEDGN